VAREKRRIFVAFSTEQFQGFVSVTTIYDARPKVVYRALKIGFKQPANATVLHLQAEFLSQHFRKRAGRFI